MNSEAEIIGERLAKGVVAHAAALDVINARVHIFSWWHVCVLLALVAGNTWLGTHAESTTMFVVGAVAQLGFLLAINAHVECIKLRKRLDAALVLLREYEQR